MLRDIILLPFGVPHLNPRSQERPPTVYDSSNFKTVPDSSNFKTVLNSSNFQCYTIISQSLKKQSTPILFQMKSMVGGIILEQFRVPDLGPKSQEHPPNFPDRCQIYLYTNPSTIFRYI